MSDWPPESGSRVLTNQNAVTATASGTANTKGSYAVLATATTFFSPYLVVIISFNTEAAYLIDVAIGASGSEVIILADLHYSGRVDVPMFVGLPLAVPNGSRITIRCACSTASATITATVQVLGSGMDLPVPRNIFTTYGQVASASLGTQIDPGSSGVITTKGSYVQITSSTTRSHKGLLMCIGNQGLIGATSASWLIDVAVGAPGSEVVQISNYRVTASAADTILPSPSPIYPVSIPAGSALSVRASCNVGTSPARLIGVVLYGIT